MKNVLCFIGAAIYGIVISYLLWLLFDWFTIWAIRNMEWGYIVILYFLAYWVSYGIFYLIAIITAFPIRGMCAGRHWVLMLIPTLSLIFHGYCSVAIPWHLHPQGWKAVLESIFFSIQYFVAFIIVGVTWWTTRNTEK